MSAWISIISDEDASPDLKAALDVACTPHGTVDNVMRVHSHRPNTMHGHCALYRAALHDPANTLPTWLQEVISSYVSVLNACDYSYANHWKNAAHLIDDAERASKIEIALATKSPETAFQGVELALLRYAEKLTVSPGQMKESDVAALRDEGLRNDERRPRMPHAKVRERRHGDHRWRTRRRRRRVNGRRLPTARARGRRRVP